MGHQMARQKRREQEERNDKVDARVRRLEAKPTTAKWSDLKEAKYKDAPERLKRVERDVARVVKKPQRLTHQTCVRFTDEQWKQVNAYAKKNKQDLAEAIRLAVLYFAQPYFAGTRP